MRDESEESALGLKLCGRGEQRRAQGQKLDQRQRRGMRDRNIKTRLEEFCFTRELGNEAEAAGEVQSRKVRVLF